MHRKVPCFPQGLQPGAPRGSSLGLSCGCPVAVWPKGLLASCIHQLVKFFAWFTASLLVFGSDWSVLLGQPYEIKICFWLTLSGLVQSRSNSWSTAWSYCSCSYISKLIVNMKLGITAQNLWLTCRISQEASVAHWQQASQRSHPGKDSSLLRALLPFPIHDTCFTYIWAPQCCPLTKLRYTGSPAQPEDHWCVWSHPGLQSLKYQL